MPGHDVGDGLTSSSATVSSTATVSGFAYSYEGHKMFRIVSDKPLPEGDATVQYGFEVTGKPDLRNGKGTPGTGTLAINGEKVGSVDMDVTVPCGCPIFGRGC